MQLISSNKGELPHYMGVPSILILLLQFLSFFTFFMFVPTISTHFNQTVGFSVGFVGLILAIRIISQQGMMILGGFLADRIGFKRTALSGFIMRGIGFASFGLTTQPMLIIVAAILTGLGGALFSPALKANLTALTPRERHKEVFSLMNIVENTGTVLGPLAGLYFNEKSFMILSVLAGVLFVVISIVVFFLPHTTIPRKSSSWIQESTEIVKNKQFMLLTVSLIPFHFVYQQLYLTIPIVADKVSGSSGWIFSYVTVIVILFQWPLLLYTKKRRIEYLFTISYFVLLAMLLPNAIESQLWTLVLTLTGIAIGAMIFLPVFQSYVAKIAPKESLGAYFGFSNMAMALGGSLGNLAGGLLYDFFVETHSTDKFWLALSLFILLPIVLLLKVQSYQPKHGN
ncbi:MFS transporter [Fictibacillus sp. S7]|uniref:MFS transporter n=1 Tax=Fictibacillus sp. S7 TaxID=2212476 RepID=UPI001010E48A|nr:MFS transporter [Fictibacillus sp. S7]